MNENKEYESPKMEVIKIELSDIITDSNETHLVPGNPNNP